MAQKLKKRTCNCVKTETRVTKIKLSEDYTNTVDDAEWTYVYHLNHNANDLTPRAGRAGATLGWVLSISSFVAIVSSDHIS